MVVLPSSFYLGQTFEPEFWIFLSWYDPRLSHPAECLALDLEEEELLRNMEDEGGMQHGKSGDDDVSKLLWMPPLDLMDGIEMRMRHSFMYRIGINRIHHSSF